MAQIVEFYKELNQRVRTATTRKQLQLYQRRGRLFMKKRPTLHEQEIARKHYSRTLELIRQKTI